MEKLPQLVDLSYFTKAQTMLSLVHRNIFDASPRPLPSSACPEGQLWLKKVVKSSQSTSMTLDSVRDKNLFICPALNLIPFFTLHVIRL